MAFDLSALVRYITRFTEESFASLIAVIFIAEAFKKLWGMYNFQETVVCGIKLELTKYDVDITSVIMYIDLKLSKIT